jgi:hypothetical protein
MLVHADLSFAPASQNMERHVEIHYFVLSGVPSPNWGIPRPQCWGWLRVYLNANITDLLLALFETLGR